VEKISRVIKMKEAFILIIIALWILFVITGIISWYATKVP